MHFDICCARWPVSNLQNFGFVRDVSVIVAELSNDKNFRETKKQFLCRDGGSCMFETVQDSIDIHIVFSNESSNARVLRNKLIQAIRKLVLCAGSQDVNIVLKVQCNFNFSLKDKCDIILKDGGGISPSFGKDSKQ